MQLKRHSRNLYERLKELFDAVVKYRYAISLVVFALLVIFRINGSNINCWGTYIDEQGHSTVVAGQARDIRSDEWSVLVPIYLSQQNGDTPFSVINKDITPSGHNVVITLDAPVKDIYTITQPLNWGFLFLKADYALSWYWDLKLILILLLSFELCMMLTRQSKLISAMGALWIALSPAVQWWFAQHVGNNVLYIEAIVVTFYYFFKYFDSLILKIVFAFAFCCACLGFVVPLYPPIQVPFGFLAILLMVLILLDFRKRIKFRKVDAIIIGAAAVFTVVMLGHLYLIIKNAIGPMNNTIYPGKRISTGGGTKGFYFYSFLTNIILPYYDVKITNENACELSSFINFLPAVVCALPILIHRRSKTIKYGVVLSIYSVFFALYMAFSFMPKTLAKITLLSYVTGSRAMLAYAYAGMLLSIWALAEICRTGGGLKRIYSLIVSLAVAASCFATVELTEIRGDIRVRYYLVIILGFALLNYLLLRGHRRTFVVLMTAVAIAAGATVNPVNIGAGAIMNNTISKEIRAVDQKNQGAVWMAVDAKNDPLGATGILIYANGAKSVGGINNYPDMQKWSLIDPQHKYANVYNRSAHISFQIVTGKTNFVLLTGNSFLVNINVQDLAKLNVKFILSNKNLTQYDGGGVSFKSIEPPDGRDYTIYQVSYAH